jgi:ubiquinone/menaquinone biosynthesis C-methylase UbiE
MEDDEYDTLAALEDRHWWYAGQRAIAGALLRRVPLSPNAAILDAGCGVGGGLTWLRESAGELGTVTGIDLHPRALRHAAQVSRRVARASVEALPFPEQSFDLVTSFEVLYHLDVADDLAALREFARVLRPGGWLMVRVPAHDWLRGAHDRQVHTRHRYSRREMGQKLRQAGFSIQRLSYVGAFLFPLAAVRRLAQRQGQAHTDVTLPGPFLNALLTRLLAAEGAWLPWLNTPLGLSVIAVAQKQ